MEISTPGRICLFGEHQDYLGLPIIALAISLRLKLIGEKKSGRTIHIIMPDIKEQKKISLDDLIYRNSRDYFRSGIKVCQNEGLRFSEGFICKIKSQIPIKAGTSSSSALVVSWINFLSKMADYPVKWDQIKIAEVAYKAEVEEFNESGGMMDQYSTSLGEMIYLESSPKVRVKKINTNLGTFVLGDSGEEKDTIKILDRCKLNQKLVLDKIYQNNSEFNLYKKSQPLDLSILTEIEKKIFNGLLKSKNILELAYLELKKSNLNKPFIGNLLSEHHQVLRDVLKVSTPKIDRMIEAAIEGGAYGGKINGSGGGGCMFAYAPKNPEQVAKAIKSVGGKAYIVNSDVGTIKIKEV
jgi:galactokinase